MKVKIFSFVTDSLLKIISLFLKHVPNIIYLLCLGSKNNYKSLNKQMCLRD